jgi:hypothetical protein
MSSMIFTALMLLLAGPVLAQESSSAVGDETKSSDQAKDKAEAKTVASAKEPNELVIPPGFKAKKRGEVTLYCIKGKATGTRFATESCYDEAGLRDYILKREQSNREFDQNRMICSNPAVCAPQ